MPEIIDPKRPIKPKYSVRSFCFIKNSSETFAMLYKSVPIKQKISPKNFCEPKYFK